MYRTWTCPPWLPAPMTTCLFSVTALSDNGNLHALNAQAPVRFTNGPVAAEVVAAQLGLSLTPSYHLLQTPPFGNNYAIAGAKAVDDDGDESTPDINLPTQVNAFLQIHGGVAPRTPCTSCSSAETTFVRHALFVRQESWQTLKRLCNASRKAARDAIAKSVESEKKQIMKLSQPEQKHCCDQRSGHRCHPGDRAGHPADRRFCG